MATGKPAKSTQQDIQNDCQYGNHEGTREHFGVVTGCVTGYQQPA
jgi:hypothetical protein